MKIVLKFILIAAVTALGVWLWLVFFPSPEKAIRHQLTRLADKISFSSDQGNLARIAGAAAVADFFSTNVEVSINIPGHEQYSFLNRDDINQAVMASRLKLNGLTVRFPDIIVTVLPDNQNATADLTVEAAITGETDTIVQEIKVTLRKVGREWQITQVQTVRTLS